MLKYDNWSIGGENVRDNDIYEVYDNTELEKLVISKTRLRENKSTKGHRHAGQEEVHIFINGEGEMEVDHEIFPVKSGDSVLIKDNQFHKVHNKGKYWLEFICVFNGARV